MSTPIEPKAPFEEKAAAELPVEPGEKKRRRRNERNAAMYDDEVFELLQAIDAWRRKSQRSFPAWSEVIQIMKGLGWQKAPAAVGAGAAATASAAAASASDAPIEPIEPVAPRPR